ncbi:MAG: hypothetical protein IJM64_02555 [Ottowia sp.]|nr:hypothetical protein [Ottowia sp.]
MKLKTLTAAAALFAAFGSATAQTASPSMVFLSTLEDRTNFLPGQIKPHDWPRYIDRPRRMFEEEVKGRFGTFENFDEYLDASMPALDEAKLKAADIIVIVTGRGAVDAARFDIIKPLMEKTDPTKPQTFIIFSEGYPAAQGNTSKFADTLATMMGGGTLTRGGARQVFPLNENSPYADAAKGVMQGMEGSSYSQMANIPSEFAMYTLNSVAPGDTSADAYLTFVPHDKANGGACTFFVGDLSLFLNNDGGDPDMRDPWTRACQSHAGHARAVLQTQRIRHQG